MFDHLSITAVAFVRDPDGNRREAVTRQPEEDS
jgi:hypothetical protein